MRSCLFFYFGVEQGSGPGAKQTFIRWDWFLESLIQLGKVILITKMSCTKIKAKIIRKNLNISAQPVFCCQFKSSQPYRLLHPPPSSCLSSDFFSFAHLYIHFPFMFLNLLCLRWLGAVKSPQMFLLEKLYLTD